MPELSKILYVDDEPVNLELFEFSYSDNYNIITALSAKESLEILKKNTDVKLIISDQRMPEMKGTELLNIIKKKYPDIVQIILTAYTDIDVIKEAINNGDVYRFLTKPWNKDELKVSIDNAIEAYDLRIENIRLLNDLKESNDKLTYINENLEKIVYERTQEVQQANEELETANEEYYAINEELTSTNEELDEANNKLESVNKELNSANKELNITNEQLFEVIKFRQKAEAKLKEYQNKLESLVEERTLELKNREEQLRTLSDNIPDGAIIRGQVLKDNFILQYASANYFKITGIKKTKNLQLKDIKICDNILPEYFSVFKKLLKESKKNLSVLDIEVKYQQKKKQDIWLHFRMMPHKTKSGKVLFDGLITDISKRKEDEKMLQLMKFSLDKNRNAIYWLNKKGGFYYVNESAYKRLGYSGDELINMKVSDINYYSVENRWENIIDTLEKDRSIKLETTHKTKDGKPIPVEITADFLEYESNEYIFAFTSDITERKKAEELIKKNELKFRNIFNSTTNGITIIDLKYNFIELNDAVLLNIGYKKEELLELSVFDILTPASINIVKERMLRLSQGEQLPGIEVEAITKDGEFIPIEISSKIIDYNGETAIMSIINNISERKQMDRMLLETIIQTEEKEREKFAQNLHDDIGPLLSSIKLYSNSLIEANDPKRQKYIVEKINEIVKEAIQSTQEISNDLSPHILINYGLESALKSYINKMNDSIKINFKCDIGKNRLNEIIETNFYRITKELINNTLKHANAKEANISILLSHKYLSLIYEDDGTGMTKEKGEGSGMGFFNIKNRIKSLNGKSKLYKNKKGGFGFDLIVPVKQ